MAQVTLPYSLTAGTPENVNNLTANLNALRDGVNTIDTAQIANGAVTNAKLADKIPAKPTYETALPSSPVDGQEIYYAASATNGVIWHLRYRSGSSSSYKWECVGGGALAESVLDGFYYSGTTWGAGTKQGTGNQVSITAPLTGVYQVRWGTPRSYNDGTSATELFLGVSVNAADPTSTNYASQVKSTTANSGGHLNGTAQVEVTTASHAITLRGKTSNGALWHFIYGQYLFVRPVRVG